MSPGDRVLIRPLGVRGTLLRENVRPQAVPGLWAVMADCAGQAVVWHESELEPVDESQDSSSTR